MPKIKKKVPRQAYDIVQDDVVYAVVSQCKSDKEALKVFAEQRGFAATQMVGFKAVERKKVKS